MRTKKGWMIQASAKEMLKMNGKLKKVNRKLEITDKEETAICSQVAVFLWIKKPLKCGYQ
jgi:hypothetical protein